MDLKIRKNGILYSRNSKNILLIAGPCSVESEKQIMDTALALKDSHLNILRGGIWKPRTRPNCFEGVGGKGLAWLKKAGEAILAFANIVTALVFLKSFWLTNQQGDLLSGIIFWISSYLIGIALINYAQGRQNNE